MLLWPLLAGPCSKLTGCEHCCAWQRIAWMRTILISHEWLWHEATQTQRTSAHHCRACAVGRGVSFCTGYRPCAERWGSCLHAVLAAGLQQGRAVRRLKGGIAAGMPACDPFVHFGMVLRLVTITRCHSQSFDMPRHCHAQSIYCPVNVRSMSPITQQMIVDIYSTSQ